jgi:hypothetical protein
MHVDREVLNGGGEGGRYHLIILVAPITQKDLIIPHVSIVMSHPVRITAYIDLNERLINDIKSYKELPIRTV